MKLTLLLSFCICLNTNAQKLTRFIKDFPDFKEVVDHFYDTYKPVTTNSNYYYLEFARKPYGWYIYKNDISNKDTQGYMIWNIITGYIPLINFQTLGNISDTTKIDDHLAKENIYNEHTIRMFKIHTFYGYNGWQQDIIKNLEPINTELNDEDLYSLARAYSISFIEVQNDTSLLKLEAIEKKVEFTTEEAIKNILKLFINEIHCLMIL